MLRLINSATLSLSLCASLAIARPATAQSAEADSTVVLLQELIRANSSNPGGSTKLVADVLAPRFRRL
ncbi:MAG: hypothetical protein ABI442_18160, partial [Gemmatimonadaceae bacterium]